MDRPPDYLPQVVVYVDPTARTPDNPNGVLLWYRLKPDLVIRLLQDGIFFFDQHREAQAKAGIREAAGGVLGPDGRPAMVREPTEAPPPVETHHEAGFIVAGIGSVTAAPSNPSPVSIQAYAEDCHEFSPEDA